MTSDFYQDHEVCIHKLPGDGDKLVATTFYNRQLFGSSYDLVCAMCFAIVESNVTPADILDNFKGNS